MKAVLGSSRPMLSISERSTPSTLVCTCALAKTLPSSVERSVETPKVGSRKLARPVCETEWFSISL